MCEVAEGIELFVPLSLALGGVGMAAFTSATPFGLPLPDSWRTRHPRMCRHCGLEAKHLAEKTLTRRSCQEVKMTA